MSLWLGNDKTGLGENALNVIQDAFIGLAPVVDLLQSYHDVRRQEFIEAFLGCTSPIALLPAQGKQVIFHGENDEVLPVVEIDEYARQAQQKGTPVELIKIADGEHMDFCDPDSLSTARFIHWLNAHARLVI
ncbi:MAG: alpha/beta hydrolase family protein [Symbiopectobacterium sp.]|uniref:alpha/beta hydrolase family protein n=1 Tax=Symbiopectobacterium sp. TaxID=2952789 RepID=UPI0039E90C69